MIDTIPDASITPAGPFCANASVQSLTPKTNNGGRFSPTAYLDTLGSFDPFIATAGTHRVYYSFTDGNSCSNTDSIDILVDTIPDASISLAGPFCENAGIQILTPAVNTGGSFTVTSYLDGSGNFRPALASAGTHRVYYSFTDGNGCANTDSLNIVVDTIPDASITPAGPFCLNAGIQLMTPQINSGGNFSVTSFIDAAGNFDPLKATDGTHRIYYSFIDSKGCYNIDSTDIVVNPIPDASITPDGPFCVNDLTQQLTPATNLGGLFTITAFIDDLGKFRPQVAGIGTHRVYYTFIDVIGCSNTDSLDLRVLGLPDASIMPEGPFCANDPIVKIMPLNRGGSFYGGPFINSSGDFDPTQGIITDNWIYYTLTDANACTNVDSFVVVVNSLPTNTITVNPDEGCEPLTVDYSTQVEDYIVWTLGAETTIDQTNVQSVLTAGTYQLYLEVFNTLGCSISVSQNILAHPKPIAQFGFSPDVVYLDNPTYFFNDQSNGTVVGWDWRFGDGQSSDQSNPTHNYTAGGTYQVTLFIEDRNGCRDTTDNEVIVRDNLLVFIPSSFSPNADGNNDVFTINGVGYTQVSCQIYSRWGEKILDRENFNAWDGTYMGEVVQNGVYIYQITMVDYAGRKYHRKGTIQVLR